MKKMLACLAIVVLMVNFLPAYSSDFTNSFVIAAGSKTITVNGAAVELENQVYISINPRLILQPTSSRLLVGGKQLSKIFGVVRSFFSSANSAVITLKDYSVVKVDLDNQTCFSQNTGYPMYPCPSEVVDGNTFVSIKAVASCLGIETKWDEKNKSLSASWTPKSLDESSTQYANKFDWGIVKAVKANDSTFEMDASSGNLVFKASEQLLGSISKGQSLMVCFEASKQKDEAKQALWAFKTDLPYGKTYTQLFAGSTYISVTGFLRNYGCKPYMVDQTMMLPMPIVSSFIVSGSGGRWDGNSLKYTLSTGWSDISVTVGSKDVFFGPPGEMKKFVMAREAEFHDGQICVSYEILSAIGAGIIELDTKLGRLTVVTETKTPTIVPLSYRTPFEVNLSKIDCVNGTAEGASADGTQWLLTLDKSTIDCSKLKVGGKTVLIGHSYVEDGKFKLYCDLVNSGRFTANKKMYDLGISSFLNGSVVANDKLDGEVVVRKPSSDWMRVGTNWKCYGYTNWSMNVTKAREIDEQTGKMISCGYFRITQDGKEIVASDEHGTERKMIITNVPWQAGSMLKKGSRYLVRFVDNPDGSLKVIDFRQASDGKTGLVFVNGKLGTESCTFDQGKSLPVKFDQPFMQGDKLYVSIKVFRQNSFIGSNYEENEVTDDLELVTFKAGSDILSLGNRQVTLSAPPIAINFSLMVTFEDFAKIFAKSHSFNKETGEFSAEMYVMPTFSYSDSTTIQIRKIDKTNLTITGIDDIKKQWKIYFWDAKLLDRFQENKVYLFTGIQSGDHALIGCANSIALDKKSIIEGMEPETIIMGSVASVDVAGRLVKINDTKNKSWTVRDNGNDLKLLTVGQKLIVEATKDQTPVVLNRWTMKTLPTPKVVKSTVRFNSGELVKDGKKYRCAQLDMVNGVLMFDYTMLMQMLPTKTKLSESRLDVWYWGNVIHCWRENQNALVNYAQVSLPAFTKKPLFELPVFWTLDNLGVKYNWDAGMKVLTVEAEVLPVPHDDNFENLEMSGKVVYSGVGLVKVSDGKRDILVYPNNLSFAANVKKNDTVWICGMHLGTDDGYVYSDLILPVSKLKPTIVSVKATKTAVDGNPKCFELTDKSGKKMIAYSSADLKPEGLYRVKLVSVTNNKNRFVATMVEGIDQY